MLKTCAYCGKEFETTRDNKIYCSRKCYQTSYRKRYLERAKASPIKTCGYCGKTFETKHYTKKYCSKECAKEANLAQKREAWRAKNGDNHKESLCWRCIHAVPCPKKGTGCSWSRSVGKVPVEGCEYQAKIISPCNGNGHKKQTLLIITKCPKFRKG